MASIVNLTPHAVNVCGVDGKVVATFPSQGVARAVQRDVKVGELQLADGVVVDLVSSTYGEPVDLPAPAEATYYVVSILTAQAAKAAGRVTSDLLVTADLVRNEAGQIVGCRKFATI